MVADVTAAFVRLTVLRSLAVVGVLCVMRRSTHHRPRQHLALLGAAVHLGMMTHATFEHRNPCDALHRQGKDEQAQEK